MKGDGCRPGGKSEVAGKLQSGELKKRKQRWKKPWRRRRRKIEMWRCEAERDEEA